MFNLWKGRGGYFSLYCRNCSNQLGVNHKKIEMFHFIQHILPESLNSIAISHVISCPALR